MPQLLSRGVEGISPSTSEGRTVSCDLGYPAWLPLGCRLPEARTAGRSLAWLAWHSDQVQHSFGKTYQLCNSELQALIHQGLEACLSSCCQCLAIARGEGMDMQECVHQQRLQSVAHVFRNLLWLPVPRGNLFWPQRFSALITDESLHKTCRQSAVQVGEGLSWCAHHFPSSKWHAHWHPVKLLHYSSSSLKPPLTIPALRACPQPLQPQSVYTVHFLMVSRNPGFCRCEWVTRPLPVNSAFVFLTHQVPCWVEFWKEVLFQNIWSLYNLSCTCLVTSC